MTTMPTAAHWGLPVMVPRSLGRSMSSSCRRGSEALKAPLKSKAFPVPHFSISLWPCHELQPLPAAKARPIDGWSYLVTGGATKQSLAAMYSMGLVASRCLGCSVGSGPSSAVPSTSKGFQKHWPTALPHEVLQGLSGSPQMQSE